MNRLLPIVIVLSFLFFSCTTMPNDGIPTVAPETLTLPVTITPTPAFGATETPTPSATIEATATQEATATPQDEIEQNAAYKEIIDAEYKGIPIHVEILTDKSVVGKEYPFPTIDKIYLNSDPNFQSRYGEDAKTSVAHAILYAEYQAWQKNTDASVNSRAGVDFESWLAKVKKHYDNGDDKNPNADWSDVNYETNANDLTTPAYDPALHTFRPGDDVRIVYTDGGGIYQNTMEKALDYFDFGIESDKNGKLALFIGNYPYHANGTKGYVVNATSAVDLGLVLKGLSLPDFKGGWVPNFGNGLIYIQRYGSEYFKILTKPEPPPKIWNSLFTSWRLNPYPVWASSALDISPNDEAKLQSQH